MGKAFRKGLVSVIIPVYNVEKYISRCIDSVLTQTYDNYEIILVDDGSKDSSYYICKQYATANKKIKLCHKENGGVSSARNLGLKNANGEYIAFIDADDYVDDNYLKILIGGIEDSDISICGYYRVCGKTVEARLVEHEITQYNKKQFLEKILNVQNGFGLCHMKLIRHSIIENIMFDEQLKVGEDAFFMANISNKVNCVTYINEPLYYYYFNENSLVRAYNNQYLYNYYDAMLKMYEYINDNKIQSDSIYNYIAYHVLLILVNYCCNRSNKEKIKSIKHIYKIDLFNKAIKLSNYSQLTITRKISLFAMKYRLILLAYLIGIIRQSQFRKG